MANLLDTFTRAATELTPFALSNHTSNSGATWKNESATTNGLVLTTSNTVVDNGGNGSVLYSVTGGTGAPTSTDYSVGTSLTVTGTPGGNFGVAFHVDTVNNLSTNSGNGYIAGYVAGPGWAIYRINAGVFTSLAASSTPTLAVGTTAIVGTIKTNTNDVTITLSVAGTVVATAVDTATNRITTGPAGIFGYALGQSGTVAFGNYTAQDTVATVIASVPSGVSATGAAGQNNIAWTASPGATSYGIQRGTTMVGPFAAVGTSAGTTYADTSATVGTAYYYTVTAINTAGTSAASTVAGPATATAATPNVVYPDSSLLRYSPGNWQITGVGNASKAASTNPGAYIKQYFANAASLSIAFDVSLNAGQSSGQIPMVAVRIDAGSWQYFPVAATITPALPPSRAAYRLLEIAFASIYSGLERWAVGSGLLAPVGSIVFAGLTYGTGATSALVPARKYKVLVLGDSIVEGGNINTNTGTAYNMDNNALVSWSFALQTACNAEVGCVGFSGQAVTNTTYSGTLPVATTTYNALWNGVARSFAGLDAVILEWGTNDGTADAAMTTGLTTIGNGMRTGNAGLKILLLKNNFDRVSSGITTAGSNISATVDGGLVNVLTLAVDTLDNTHPTASAANTKYVPAVAQALNNVLGASSVPTGNILSGISIFKFVGLAADNISNYPGLGIVWNLPDAGTWASGKPGGPAGQAVTQFLPGKKYYVYNTTASTILLYGAQF